MTPDPFSTWLNNFANDLRGKPKEEPEVQDKEDEEEATDNSGAARLGPA